MASGIGSSSTMHPVRLNTISTVTSPQLQGNAKQTMEATRALAENVMENCCISVAHDQDRLLSVIVKSAVKNLEKANLATPENLEAVSTAGLSAGGVCQVIVKLHKANLLTSENLSAIRLQNGKNAWLIGQAILRLHKNDLYTLGNLKTILVQNGDNAYEICKAIIRLHRKDLYTPVNRDAILLADGEYARNISKVIIYLHNAALPEENLKPLLVDNGKKAFKLFNVIKFLYKANLLTQENFKKILQEYEIPVKRIECKLRRILEKNRLTQERFDELLFILNKKELVYLDRTRDRANLLGINLRKLSVNKGEKASQICDSIRYLCEKRSFTQEDFNNLIGGRGIFVQEIARKLDGLKQEVF